MTWWPRWQLVKEKDSRLISQCVICTLCFFISFLPFSSHHSPSSLLFSLAPSPSPRVSLPHTPHLLFTLLLLQFLSYQLYFAPFLPLPPFNFNTVVSQNALFFSFTSSPYQSYWPHVTLGRIITLGCSIGSVAPCAARSSSIIHLWSIPFCGEPFSYSPVMIGVLATLCICTVI